jgi:hypothetical protein
MDELQEHVHSGASVSSVRYGSVRGAFQLIESLGRFRSRWDRAMRLVAP